MIFVKAIIHAEKKGLEGISFQEVNVPKVGPGEVRIQLKTAGLNHRDLFIPNRHQPEEGVLVLGSDGAGIVEAIGEGVSNVKVGDEIVINPSLGWEKNTPAPPEGFEILGYPFDGTFAEYVTIPAENAFFKAELFIMGRSRCLISCITYSISCIVYARSNTVRYECLYSWHWERVWLCIVAICKMCWCKCVCHFTFRRKMSKSS